MSIDLSCPRCKSTVSVPDEMAGEYAFCSNCQGRVWVAGQAATSNTIASSSSKDVATPHAHPPGTKRQTTATPPPPQAPSAPRAPSAPTSDISPSPPGTHNQPPPAKDPMAPVTGALPAAAVASPTQSASPLHSPRRVAKFITADVAQSNLELASDGELPGLRLSEHGDKKRRKARSESATQWRLVLLICGSLTVSTLLLFMGPTPVDPKPDTTTIGARERIKKVYFGPKDGPPEEKYQEYLREAFLARSQENFNKERYYYRKVLHLLLAEHHDADTDDKGITGQRRISTDKSLPSDEDLEQLLSILLNSP